MKRTVIIAFAIISYSILVLAALYRAFISPSSDTSGWLQVVIELTGLPLLIFGLVELNKNLQLSRRDLKIAIGITKVQTPLIELEDIDSLPTVYTNPFNRPSFSLIIRNDGTKAAKYVKITLQHLTYEEETYCPRFSPMKGNEFKPITSADFEFIGGADWILYPQAISQFYFEFNFLDRDHLREIINKDGHRLDTLRCTIWADELEKPMISDLTIKTIWPK